MKIRVGVVFGGGIRQRRLIIRRSIGRTPTGEQVGIRCRLVDGDGLAGALHAVGIAPEIADIIAFVARFIIKIQIGVRPLLWIVDASEPAVLQKVRGRSGTSAL